VRDCSQQKVDLIGHGDCFSRTEHSITASSLIITDHQLERIRMTTLQLNQALLVFQNLRQDAVTLCHQVTECNKCELLCPNETPAGANSSLILSSQFIHRIAVKVADINVCMTERSFLDREECVLTVYANSSSCSFTTTKEGTNELIPLWTMIGVYFMLAAIISVGIHFW
jgi:hypothetical protein